MAKAKEGKTGNANNTGDAAPTAEAQPAEVVKDIDAKEGPVLTVIQRRLRAANKKLKRCEELEASRAAGKTLNSDQVCPQEHCCVWSLIAASSLKTGGQLVASGSWAIFATGFT